MKKTITLQWAFFMLCSLLTSELSAQLPPPCLPTSGGIPATDGPPGCLLCGPIYSGNNGGYGATPPNPPCWSVQNNLYVAVLADATGNLTATVVPSNCQNGNGLHLVIFDSGLNLVSNCDVGGGGVPQSVTAGGLTPGEIYYVMIDGWAGDVCDFLLTVAGSEGGSPPPPAGPITADPDPPYCPGMTICYDIPPLPNVTFEWEVPGNATIVSGGGDMDTQVCVEFNSAGGGVIKVTPISPCFPGIPAILPVTVLPVLPTLLPLESVCTDDFPIQRDGFTFSAPGANTITLMNDRGCDSMVTYTFIPLPQIPTVIDTFICHGETLTIGNTDFDSTGSYRFELGAPFFQENGCDSLVILSLQVIEPVAQIAPPGTLDCTPNASVTLDGGGSSSGNNISYQWTTNNGMLTPPLNQQTVQATAAGTYVLAVSQTNAAGTVTCVETDTIEVVQQGVPLAQPVFTNSPDEVCAASMHTYSISPVANATGYVWTVPNGATFSGSGTSIDVNFGTAVAGTVCVTATGDCSDSPPACVTITISPNPIARFTADSPICINDPTSVEFTGTAGTNATYNWNFNGGMPATVTGPGPHSIIWNSPGTKTITLTVDENGCGSNQASETVLVEPELAMPVISCTSTTTSVTFSWNPVPGATDYTVTVGTNPPVTQTTTTITETGLTPGQTVNISVVANGTTACGTSMNTSNCVAQNCAQVSLNIDAVPSICRDPNTGTIQLTANPTGGTGGGTFTWSGTGVSPAGVFDPQNASAGINVITLEYVEGTCDYREPLNITVNDIPDASFTFNSPICLSANANITYTGSASANANYTWDFDGGTVVSGTGQGPYEINWSAAGTPSISLTVEENGCTSNPNVQSIQVDDELPQPVIRCLTTTLNEIVFEWDIVPGATSYTVNGPGVVDQTNRTVTVSGLNTGDMITIEVVATGSSACGDSRNSQTCVTSSCPPVPVMPAAIGPFCKDGNATPVQLSATAGDNTGVFVWSGAGVTGNMFDPNASSVNPGTLNLRVVYTKDNCDYDASLPVVINAQPSADFDLESPICEDNTSTIFYSGNAAATADFDWNFDGGNVNSGTGTMSDPFEIEWTSSGAKNLSLTVTENNCASAPNMQSVQVDEALQPLVVTCTSNQNSIDFTWGAIPNALTYDVELLDGTAGIFDGTLNYNVTGLNPGDEVEIGVIVTGTTVCGTVGDTLRCEAKNCPTYSLAMPSVPPICLSGGVAAFDLDTMISIVNMLGDNLIDSVRLRWHDGNDMNDYISSGGMFFPTAAGNTFGAGAAPIAVEVEYPIGSGCFQTFTSTIELNPLPNNFITFNQDSICVTDVAMMTLASTPDPTAVFDWDFGQATVVSGSGAGPYELSWTQAGIVDTITLILTENGCTGFPISRTIRVDEAINPLAANLRCNPDNTGNTMIEFVWDPVLNATDYQVNVVTPGFSITSSTATSAFFDGLSPNDEITIELVVSNPASACPAEMTSFTCRAKQCPPTVVEIQPILDTCLIVGSTNPIQMMATIQDDPTNMTGISEWTGGTHITTDGIFTPSGEGTYSFGYTYTSDGCTYTDNLTIRMWDQPVADFMIDDRFCETDAANIAFTGSASPNAVFNWDFDGGSISGTNDDPQTINWTGTGDTGSQTISLTINNNGCESTQSEQIQVDPENDPITITCDPSITTTTSVGFTWNDNRPSFYDVFLEEPLGSGNFQLEGQGLFGPGYQVDGLPVGTGGARIRVVAVSPNACPDVTDEQFCPVLPCPTINIDISPVAPLCIDAASVPILFDPQGSDGSGTFSVSGNGIDNGRFDPQTAGVGTQTVTVEFIENGCTYSNTIDIEVNPIPDVEAGDMQVLSCDAEMVRIGEQNPITGATYRWELNGDAVGATPEIDVDEGGDYTLFVTDANGCMNSDDVFVDASFSDPQIDAQVTQITCFGRNDGQIQVVGMMGGVPPFEYSFNGSDFSSDDFFPNLGAGTYNITGRDTNGCESDITFQITEPDELTVEIVITAGENPTTFPDSLQLEAVTNYAPDLLSNVSWSPSEQFPICDETNIINCLTAWVSPTGQTVYTVRIENLNGCPASDDIRIDVQKVYPVYIPSAFSPRDQNGINDVLQIYGDLALVKEIKTFSVFDRWGNMLYNVNDFEPSAGSDPGIGWDGRFQGKMLNSGVYIFYAEVEFFDGLTEIFKGDVTLR